MIRFRISSNFPPGRSVIKRQQWRFVHFSGIIFRVSPPYVAFDSHLRLHYHVKIDKRSFPDTSGTHFNHALHLG